MKPSFLSRVALAAVFLVTAGAASAQNLLLGYDLGSGHAFTTWNTLNNANPSFDPTEGSGVLGVNSPGYAAGAGLYSFAGPYGVTVTQDGLNIRTVVLQLDLQPNGSIGFGGGPQLTYTAVGGSGTLAATWSAVTGIEDRVTSMGPGTFTNWSFQWDLSGIADDITSVSVLAPIPAHSSTMAARIDVGSTAYSYSLFAPVPEPSAAALGLGALGLTLLHRRRA